MKIKITTILFCAILIMPVFAISAVANEPPSAPTIDGPINGTIGEQITYGFCSTDPDGDNITICINWGDDTGDICIGPFQSGLCATAFHIWIKKGTYTIKAKASDGQAESSWSTLEVTMPRVKAFYSTPIIRLFMHFPNALLIIKQIFKS